MEEKNNHEDSYPDHDVDWVFYKDRLEWKDITPIPQNDSPHPVVQIAYSARFQDIFDYFRAVLANKEISERAFQLTEDAANANPSNYTVWHYRRILLKELKLDLHAELKYIQCVIEDNPKNYQTWHHRQVLVEWLDDPSSEKYLTERILSVDAKNYHAWQHRQWVIRTFNLWDEELDYVDKLLEDDIRNNSAWNQRYFIISQTSTLTEDILQSEIKYTLDRIEKATLNESSWNYLRGILQDAGLSKYSVVSDFMEKLYSEGCRSPYLLSFMIDSIEEKILAGGDSALCQRALEFCEMLATKHDKVRKEYWNFIARNLGNLYGPKEAHVSSSLSQDFNNVEIVSEQVV